jgi:hypothetical protein
MTDRNPTPDEETLAETERREAATVTLLEDQRPVPAPSFRGDLRRRLVAMPRRGRALPVFGSLGPQIAGSFGLGVVLMLVAAIGLAGVGPFGA